MPDTIRLSKSAAGEVAKRIIGYHGTGPFEVILENRVCGCAKGRKPAPNGPHHHDCATLLVAIKVGGFRREIRRKEDVENPQQVLTTA